MTQEVYEDPLNNAQGVGNPDGDGGDGDVHGERDACRPGVFGADEPVTITLSPTTSGLPQNLTSNGAAVVYNVTGNLLTAYVDSGATAGVLDGTDRQVFTLQITDPATGAYTFTLLDQLDHTGRTTTTTLLAINLSSVIVATDADGDFILLTGAFTISVENDIPVQVGSPVTGRFMRTC